MRVWAHAWDLWNKNTFPNLLVFEIQLLTFLPWIVPKIMAACHSWWPRKDQAVNPSLSFPMQTKAFKTRGPCVSFDRAVTRLTVILASDLTLKVDLRRNSESHLLIRQPFWYYVLCPGWPYIKEAVFQLCYVCRAKKNLLFGSSIWMKRAGWMAEWPVLGCYTAMCHSQGHPGSHALPCPLSWADPPAGSHHGWA